MRSPCCLRVPPTPESWDRGEKKTIVRQRLSKYVLIATTTHATTEEMLDAMISMRSASNQILNMK
jgi:hypothetical protein